MGMPGRVPAPERRWRLLLDVALALWLLGIACVTLLPTVGGGTGLEQGSQLRPFASIVAQLTSALDASVAFRIAGLNIVQFIPLGFCPGPVLSGSSRPAPLSRPYR